VYAVLTDEGLEKVRSARQTHLAQIEAFFTARLEEPELEELTTLLARFEDGGEELDCEPPE
jgi:DNA-binding MarR family transcriptional regulator